VGVRVGDYHLDSSNFVSDDAFRGFIGSSGQVGIDRDYDSLRQDLWLATDQAYKEALDTLSRKRGFLRTLARPPEIPDFSPATPLVRIDPRLEPDWTSRNWEEEAKAISAVFRNYPQLQSTRVTYYLVYTTSYFFTSEGTEIRISRSLAAIEASLNALANDGMPVHHFFTAYAKRPAELPDAASARRELDRTSRELVALRESPPASDYVGPVLFEAPAAASVLAQSLGPSVSGARPPLSMLPMFDQIMERLGGRSEWIGRMNTRVLPASVSLADDPTSQEFQGKALIGGYSVDQEGVRAERVVLVENGMLQRLLMSRRPGPESVLSNGHGRSSFLSEPRPAMSNLSFQATDALGPAALHQKFLDLCRGARKDSCLVVRQMDNPALGYLRQEDLSDAIAGLAGSSGDRVPLLVYRVYPSDGHEELVRGSRLTGLTLHALRDIAGIGNDYTVWNFFQNTAAGFASTALGAFGSAQGGLPSSVVAPSLLLEEVEVRGARGEPRRPPLVPPPPLD
jgi:predicted Zn-dependent protease